MTKKSKLVHGIGRNDAGYPAAINTEVDGRRKQIWLCPLYQAWKHMLERCYSAKYHERKPTYKGCSVAKEWHSFSTFRAWMIKQEWNGNQLDKDLLIPGNKVYGPDTCVFVSGKLNTFMSDCGSARGEWPLGVCWDSTKGKLISQCSNPFTGKKDHLGYFTDPLEAHEAWRERKNEHACRYAEMQTDQRIASALRTLYANKR